MLEAPAATPIEQVKLAADSWHDLFPDIPCAVLAGLTVSAIRPESTTPRPDPTIPAASSTFARTVLAIGGIVLLLAVVVFLNVAWVKWLRS